MRVKKPPFKPPIAVTVIVVAIVAGALYVIHLIPPTPPPALGVTNARIDSSTQVEFDYRRTTSCNDLTFDYLFYDQTGQQVDMFTDQKHDPMPGGRTIHFTAYAFQAIDSRAVSFKAIPTCHS